ncbi:MAG TPA: family 78 glycoside hydrolase catalytic domain [Phycisphaerae bacterium]|nr:family 78 glycoside hydrolase catalytic domain [Phycisphaerae bacterium]HPP28746.1 family 78 glycoside hydrolase catalytic domain [Phycisphaerae bacterium]HQE27589.1 family 78 glycoside hydrolase catalytic domain [Phycisphaerae bacterium]
MLSSAVGVVAEMKPVNLRCEYLENPLGIDVPRPRLSWQLESPYRNRRQAAYQILVATHPDRLTPDQADLWNSGRVESNQSLHVEYAGKPLISGMPAHWTVRVWDQDGAVSEFCPPARWEMGLLDPSQWTGHWISDSRPLPEAEADLYGVLPAPMLRKEFVLSKPVLRARAYVSGLGYYELSLNGKRVGNRRLDPAWTSYGKRVLYSTYDVTGELRPGANAVGMLLGNGWYNPLPMRLWGWLNLRERLEIGRPRGILQLNIEYQDGTFERIVTDETWRVGDSAILKNNIYLGEVYDARKELPGWDCPGFDDRAWRAAVRAPGNVGELRAQMVEPIRATRSIKPVRVSEAAPGVYIFDMGQNFAGTITLRVRGEAGTEIRLRYGELLYPDGTLNPMTSVCGQIKGPGIGGPGAPDVAYQTDTYILKGGGELETWTPRFTFHGFRYVEVTGYPGRPPLDAIEGHLMHSDVRPAGTFECSNPLFNRIQEITRWTLLSNMFGVQSDCPHRERFGYGGDIVVSAEMASFNLNMPAFYHKTAWDFADDVRPNGGFTETAPFVGIDAFKDGLGGGAGPIGWGTVQPVLLWHMYQYYGDRRLLEDQFPLAVRWMEFLGEQAVDNYIERGIGDHESIAEKVVPLTSTAFYYYNAELVSRIARIIGRSQEANRLADRAASIKASFNQRFLDTATGRYASGSQASQAFPLYMGLVPAISHGNALKVLLDDIAAHNFHLTTGIFGTKYMLSVLSDSGHADVAYRIVNQRDFPGWGHMIESGATTLWEHWEFSDNTFSHNHPMFGSVSEWFFKVLAGIRPHPEAAGFDRIVIQPAIVPGLEWVRARYDSIRGPIVSEWRIEDHRLIMHVTLPANTSALIHFPTPEIKEMREADRHIQQSQGIKLHRIERDRVIFEAGSGDYRFSMPWPPKPPGR